ncbi:hypothetical protein AB9R00_04230 [Neisseria gonorrhoeae]
MSIAHIVIEIEESSTLDDCNVRLSFSGGTELQSDEAKTVFYKTLEAIEGVLGDELKKTGSSFNCLFFFINRHLIDEIYCN